MLGEVAPCVDKTAVCDVGSWVSCVWHQYHKSGFGRTMCSALGRNTTRGRFSERERKKKLVHVMALSSNFARRTWQSGVTAPNTQCAPTSMFGQILPCALRHVQIDDTQCTMIKLPERVKDKLKSQEQIVRLTTALHWMHHREVSRLAFTVSSETTSNQAMIEDNCLVLPSIRRGKENRHILPSNSYCVVNCGLTKQRRMTSQRPCTHMSLMYTPMCLGAWHVVSHCILRWWIPTIFASEFVRDGFQRMNPKVE